MAREKQGVKGESGCQGRIGMSRENEMGWFLIPSGEF